MIQRTQSLFLFLVVLCGSFLLAVPFIAYPTSPPLFLRNPMDIIPIANYFSILLGVIAIFLYKNRKLQIRCCHVLVTLNIILFASLLLFSNQLYDHDFEKGKLQWPAYLPVIAIIDAFIAGRYIKKDEELVRSADRIR
jgi:peptidoglycan/LPS O-acetylase OafA/YrhL